MNVSWQMFRLALDQLRSHKLRSFLTVLGVVIGVMSVIFMASIIEGLNYYISHQISGLGSNIVTVTKLPQFAFRFPTEEERQRKDLTREDADTLRQEVKNADRVISILVLDFEKFPNPNVRYGNVHASNVKVYGVEPDYINIYVSYVRTGRFLSEADVLHRTPVMVLGATVAETMFPHQDPVGKTVYFENDPYEVIGVLERRGSLFGFDRDNFVWIPVTTFAKLHPEAKDGMVIALKARTQESMPKVIDEATEILRRRRHDGFHKPNSFDIGSQNQFIQLYDQLTAGVYLVLLVVASIALMVGGIGVMNIMLVSVTERTREIGVRKALGARRRDILFQFLLEAMMLTAFGGVVGILLASGVSALVDWLSPLPSRVSPFWVVVAFSVSVSVGLFFGMYPAARAARLDPIEALRYE